MIPDYQSLMRPVLACASAGETKIGDVVELLADKLGLTRMNARSCCPAASKPEPPRRSRRLQHLRRW